MTAAFTPQGLFAPRFIDGGNPAVEFNRRGGIASGYGTNIFRGDPVKMLTDGTFALAAAGDSASAVFWGWSPEDPSVYEAGGYWKAGATYVRPPQFFFMPIERVIWSIQGAGSIAMTAIGDNADWVAGTGNVRSGLSGAYLASGSLAGAGNSAGLKVRGLAEMAENEWGDAYTIVDVTFNEFNLGMVPGNAI